MQVNSCVQKAVLYTKYSTRKSAFAFEKIPLKDYEINANNEDKNFKKLDTTKILFFFCGEISMTCAIFPFIRYI